MLDDQDWETENLPGGFMVADRYRIERLLGGGAMGSVYLAADTLLNHNPVAVKVLHREYARDRSSTKRFLREVQLMHLVNHPNVVRTYDIGADGKLIFFTMEYVAGIPLDGFEYQDFNNSRLLENIAIQICAGLEAIHNSNIVHRDLKPGNILVSQDNQVKIADFGVARPVSSTMTQHREIIGSLDYMAPEIWKGQELTPAVDFYALGIILYELSTGSPPFDAEQPVAMMWLHCNELPPEPKIIRPDIPEWLNQLIMDLLAKEPAQRPRTAREIIERIESRALRAELIAGKREFPKFTAEQDAKKQEDDKLLPAADPESDNQPEEGNPKGGMRSATSGIIFRELPTADEIRAHEERVRERLQRKGRPDLSRSMAAISEVEESFEEEEDKEAIRRIERTLSFITMAAVASVGGVGLLMYKIWADEQQAKEEVSHAKPVIHSAPQPRADSSADPFGELNFVTAIIANLAAVTEVAREPESRLSLDQSDAPHIQGAAPAQDRTPVKPVTANSNPPGASAEPSSKAQTESEPVAKPSTLRRFFSRFYAEDSEQSRSTAESAEFSQLSGSTPSLPRAQVQFSPAVVEEAATRQGVVSVPVRRDIPLRKIPAPQSSRAFHPNTLTQRFPLITRFLEGIKAYSPNDLASFQHFKASEAEVNVALRIHALREEMNRIALQLSFLKGEQPDQRELESEHRSVTAALGVTARELEDEKGQYHYWSVKAQQAASPNRHPDIVEELARLSTEVREQKVRYEGAAAAYRDAENPDAVQALGERLEKEEAKLRTVSVLTIRQNLEQRLTNLINLEQTQEILQREEQNLQELLNLHRGASGALSRKELLTAQKKVETELEELLQEMSEERAELVRKAMLLSKRVEWTS